VVGNSDAIANDHMGNIWVGNGGGINTITKISGPGTFPAPSKPTVPSPAKHPTTLTPTSSPTPIPTNSPTLSPTNSPTLPRYEFVDLKMNWILADEYCLEHFGQILPLCLMQMIKPFLILGFLENNSGLD
jgi:hypothetical protein